ncbi:MAG: 50S ribosomal protein L4, large subunit ribosomal protein L4 [Candidatus Peregrinibacteria bacterium GW2011_GWC2_39_14]|nr:MAG: 50S ribosomal protein L4 [Candidatus Peregrinibacteria bacterium GW2011_GWA2_38_36]KKR06863.1 MAG: 50S ribosomal protein L4, large subunit ribosomal protein L4 [Candidatus Peregrinibacteria bacterium GW2011_GWC2_39_14]
MKIDLYNQKGEKKGQIELQKEYFEQPFNEDLIHQAHVMQTANARKAIAHTKTKAEVRGGGKKPYAQKHTGNARQGSSRNPHFVGGGVAFGPRNDRNFSKNMPRGQRRQALLSALSDKARENQIIALDKYEGVEAKTKFFAEMISKLPIPRRALFVLPAKNALIEKSSKNIASVKTILVNYLNITDLINYKTVVFLEESLGKMNEIFKTK